MQDLIKEIRVRLRLGMNGVVSQSMREKGMVYKLNFGLLLPQIKAIAADFDKNAALAEALWKEDIREFKILATLLQPVDGFTYPQAMRWIGEIPYQEIAEQVCINLLKKLPFAQELVWQCYFMEKDYFRIVAFLLVAQLCKVGKRLEESCVCGLLAVGKHVLDKGVSTEQRAALIALKQFGRQAPEQTDRVLSVFGTYKDCGCPVREEFYNDLKFEFDYYR